MAENILELDNAVFRTRTPLHPEPLSVGLVPGTLAAVTLTAGTRTLPLADTAQGLCPLEAGEARYRGVPWASCPPRTAAARRGEIGRSFAGPGWVSNLDLEENICLRLRHHTRRPLPEILEECRQYARRFGLPEIPSGRPARQPADVLQVAQWVRAFMGEPPLIVLEHPDRDVYPEQMSRLERHVLAALARGCSVLWIGREDRVPERVLERADPRVHVRPA
jgi:phospholipid/cholesterol/gamma-HCH transport system ATP-binding protein